MPTKPDFGWLVPRASDGRSHASPVGVGLLFVGVLVVVLLVAGATVAVASHYDEAEYEAGDASDFTVRSYGGPETDDRAPGATDRSYWTESVVYELPEDETVYLTESVTYRPLPSECDPSDTEEFGIDRGATREGERYVDDDATDSVQSFTLEEDTRDRYEAEFGEYGPLTTADYAYVERIEIEWYAPDEFGSPLEVHHGDRFVTAQRDCLDNPDAAGWYRWLGYNEGVFENGTEVSQETPTFSHWYWICDCEDREEAVDRLGPPPSEEGDSGGTNDDAGADADADNSDGRADADGEDEHDDVDNSDGADDPDGTDDTNGTDDSNEADDTDDTTSATEPTQTPGDEQGSASTQDATDSPGDSDGSTSADVGRDGDGQSDTGFLTEPDGSTPAPEWDERIVRTPTASGTGSGLTVSTGVVALAAGLLVAGATRRRRAD